MNVAPVFTECVSNGSGQGRSRGESREVMKRLQGLIEQIEAQSNPSARALLQECLEALLAFYGEGLARVLEQLRTEATAAQVLERLLQDQTVSALLLIHGLHPVPLEARLQAALEKVRPYMQSHGGGIEFLGVVDDVAQVRLQGTCQSCPSSTITLELAVRRAVEEACPDLLGLEVATMEKEKEEPHVPGHSR
jgi:Fe-S cluster biogenesis protein NfuA